MIPNPTPVLGEVVAINYPNHGKSLLYALLTDETENPKSKAGS
jgi:hypothetical protein